MLPALTTKCNPHHNRNPVIVEFCLFTWNSTITP